MEKLPCFVDSYFRGCHLLLKSDEVVKETLRITAKEKKLAENFIHQGRRNHFLLGRHYAHLLLSKMGYPQVTIGKKKDGAPIWGKGIKGSISHCQGKIMICGSDSQSIRAIGIDIENCSRKIKQPLFKKISHFHELQDHKNLSDLNSQLSVFCLKEAVLKCFGSFGKKLELQDIAITSFKPPLVSIPKLKLKNQKAYLLQIDNFILASFIFRRER